ncbi:MAG: glutamate--tRNA ligase, partial [Christensenellaceae bacterium]
MSEKVRTRFAPSPTGYMHIGNLRSALYGYLFAVKNGGEFILRIEDTDQTRYVDGAVQIIYDTLADAGIAYSEGPDKGGPYGPYMQSERKALYMEYAKQLIAKGAAYYCFCTPERLASMKDSSVADANGVTRYDKHCLHLTQEEIDEKLAKGVPFVIRQNIPSEGKGSYEDMVFGEVTVDYKDMEDGILIKSDGMPTYNFANVVDDHLMHINYVIRGVEYLSSTPKYNLMYDAFGWERPHYMHLSPVMKDAQHKLSKRNGDASYQDLVAKGYVKEAILNYIALLGWAPKDNTEKMTLAEMAEKFSVEGLSKSPSIYDEAKLRWLSGEYIKEMTDEEFLRRAEPFIARSKAYGKYDTVLLAKLLKGRTEVMGDIPSKIDFLEEYGAFDGALYFNKKQKCDQEVAKRILPKLYEAMLDWDDYSNAALYEKLVAFAAEIGVKNGPVLWCLRIAITGTAVTPGGASEMAELLGKE